MNVDEKNVKNLNDSNKNPKMGNINQKYNPKFVFTLNRLEIDFSNQSPILHFIKTKQNQWIFNDTYSLFDVKYKLYFSDEQTEYQIEVYFRLPTDVNFGKLSLIPNSIFYKMISGLLGVNRDELTFPMIRKLGELNLVGKKIYILPWKNDLNSFQVKTQFSIYKKTYIEIGAIRDFVVVKK